MDDTSSTKPLSEDLVFEMVGFPSKQVRDAHVNGHFTKVSNPMGRFSVSPPLPGGCGSLNFAGVSGKLHDPECLIAVNGGRFVISSADAGKASCIGNLVSDGQLIQAAPYNLSNVNFGVRRNGTFVVGYIAPEEVEGGEYEQLIEGLGWLVRNGSSYVAESWKEAYRGVGVEGDAYAAGMSGRVALGYNAKGELLVLVIDGHASAPSWGVTLYELAEKMIELGAVEAINLDGGGNTQIWYNGVAVGYSSDQAAGGRLASYDPDCPIGTSIDNLSTFECLRKVSSFICIHERASVLASPVAAAIVSDELFEHWMPVALTLALLATLLALWLLSRTQPSSEKEVLLVCDALEGGSGSAVCPGESSSDDSESLKSMA